MTYQKKEKVNIKTKKEKKKVKRRTGVEKDGSLYIFDVVPKNESLWGVMKRGRDSYRLGGLIMKLKME